MNGALDLRHLAHSSLSTYLKGSGRCHAVSLLFRNLSRCAEFPPACSSGEVKQVVFIDPVVHRTNKSAQMTPPSAVVHVTSFYS